MNCNACFRPINMNGGYYLVKGEPYCLECYRKPVDVDKIAGLTHLPSHFDRREADNLLDAFRAYQKRS